MSVREEKILSLTNVDLSTKSTRRTESPIQRGFI